MPAHHAKRPLLVVATWMRGLAAASTSLAVLTASASTHATTAPTTEQWRDVRSAAAELADELAGLCPVAAPGSQSAFESCRKGLYNDSAFRDKLNPIVLWGRQRN